MSPSEYQFIIYDKKDRVATITINRPKAMNALNVALRNEMTDALRDAEADASVHVIVITGAGDRSFSAGADVGELEVLSPLGARDSSLAAQALTNCVQRI
ncbi:MAG: enoyl-CoA hydratase/isomerase family protein, partial [Chloroflexi bacterium]|nr:enoyl-CoA hydratase/isomerase family protein [Chloroflexota bacterium]